MEFELNEFLEIIEKDFDFWCNVKMKSKCGKECKYFPIANCSEVSDAIEIVQRLAECCFKTE